MENSDQEIKCFLTSEPIYSRSRFQSCLYKKSRWAVPVLSLATSIDHQFPPKYKQTMISRSFPLEMSGEETVIFL